MNLKDRRVLVTGAAGFIGSHLVEQLVAKGAHVRAFIRYNSRSDRGWIDTFPESLTARLEIVAGDIKDSDAVRNAVKGCDAVFHLAALIGIPYSYVHPRNYVETNIVGTTNVLTAALDHGVKRVVHISTSEVYGTAQYVPIDEKHPKVGQSPYSASKISADMLAESFHRSFNLPVVIIRPFNTYGPRQSQRAVIPTIISQLMAGSELSIGATAPTRDFTFVTDTAAGMICSAEIDEAIGMTINLGVGQEISVGDLASLIAKQMNVKFSLKQDANRLRPENSEVERLLSNNGLAQSVLEWKPEIDLETGVARTIAWFRDNPANGRAFEYAR
ncbi:MAG: SDR family NAD(P)-dependent oxidoreductase [Candidatus Zixiibacteriota bacterium]